MKDISEKEERTDQEPFEEVLDGQQAEDEIFSAPADDEDFFDSDEDDLDDFDMRSGSEFDAGEEETGEDEDFDLPEPEDSAQEDEEDFDSELNEDFAASLFGDEEEEPYPEENVQEEEIPDETAGPAKKSSAGSPRHLKKAALMAAVGALCVLVVFGIVTAVMKAGKSRPVPEDTEDPAEQIVLVEQQVSDVKFLSFGPLSVNNPEGYLSVKEFSQILDTLYEDGYVLVDLYSIGNTDESGNMVLNKTIDVPEGKKPLVIMQRDVSYPISRQTDDFARKLVVDSEGCIRAEYADADNEVSMGDYDLIPMVETFIREHPDFSYNGARGVLGLTGYNGILGYRTSSYLESEENNPYGTFDTKNQTLAMQSVLDTLRNNGWRFASNGFGNRISYGSEYSLVEKDTASWKDQVAGLIGGTDILMLPRHTDIGSWAPYDEGNAKYTLMRGLGFRIYLSADDETPGFMLARNEYLRIAVAEIDSYSEFEAALSGGPIPETVISPETAEEETPVAAQADESAPEGNSTDTQAGESAPEGNSTDTQAGESTPEGNGTDTQAGETAAEGSSTDTQAGESSEEETGGNEPGTGTDGSVETVTESVDAPSSGEAAGE